MDDKRTMLRHFLATLAYRTQRALRGAPPSFGTFNAGGQARMPADLVRHMTSVLQMHGNFSPDGRLVAYTSRRIKRSTSSSTGRRP